MPNPELRKKVFNTIGILFFLILIVKYFADHRHEVAVVYTMDLKYILVLFVLFLVNNYLTSLKVLFILNDLNLKDMHFVDWFRIFIVSRFINFHISQGAFLYRTLRLKERYNFSYTSSLSVTFFFSWLENIVNLFVTWSILMSGRVGDYTPIERILLAAIVISVFLPWLLNIILLPIRVKHPRLSWMKNRAQELSDNILKQSQNLKLISVFFALTIITFGIYVVVTHISFLAINNPVDMGKATIFTITLLLSRSFNILPGNIGLAEIICGYMSQFLGETMGQGIIVSGIFRIVEYLLLACVSGILYLPFLRKR